MGRRSEAGYGAGLTFELGCRFYLRTSDEIDWFQIARAGEQHNVAAFNARGHHRFCSRAGDWSWPLMIPIVIKAPPRICTGSTFKPFLAKNPASFATRPAGERWKSKCRSECAEAPVRTRVVAPKTGRKGSHQSYQAIAIHDRASAFSSGPLSRKRSKRPINSLGTVPARQILHHIVETFIRHIGRRFE